MNQSSLLADTVLHSWRQIMDRCTRTINSFSDDDLQKEVAPGKNRVYYLVGHLAAVQDRLLPLLRLGDRLYPELDEQFLTTPDRQFAGAEFPPAKTREAWIEINERLVPFGKAICVAAWLERHDSISPEDFAREPLRNRLAVLISRLSHAAWHEGQIRMVR